MGVVADQIVGIDIGGSKIRAGLVSPLGVVSGALEIRYRPNGPAAVLDTAMALISQVAGSEASRAEAPGRVIGVGVATAGVVDPVTGRVLSAVETIPEWAGTEIGRILGDRTGLPTTVENDVNAVAVAESILGAAAGASSALVVAVGTGIGGALVVDGRLHRGATSSAGELGHLPVGPGDAGSEAPCTCGRSGHLEAVAAGPAIAAGFARRSGQSSATLEDVAAALSGGAKQVAAAAAVSAGATALGRALGGLANTFDPEVIVLYGGVLALGAPFVDQVEHALRREALPGPSTVRLALAALGSDAGLVGAALLARDRMETVPR